MNWWGVSWGAEGFLGEAGPVDALEGGARHWCRHLTRR